MKKNMFTTLMMFVAIATLTLTSCSKDPEELILGDWKATNAVMTANLGGFGMNLNLTEGFVKFSFSEDGKLTWCMREMEDMDENTLQPIFGTAVDTLYVDYVLKDDILTFVGAGDLEGMPMQFNVNELEKDKLSLVSFPIDAGDGITGEFRFDFVK